MNYAKHLLLWSFTSTTSHGQTIKHKSWSKNHPKRAKDCLDCDVLLHLDCTFACDWQVWRINDFRIVEVVSLFYDELSMNDWFRGLGIAGCDLLEKIIILLSTLPSGRIRIYTFLLFTLISDTFHITMEM